MGHLKALLPTSFPDLFRGLNSKKPHLWGSHVAVSGMQEQECLHSFWAGIRFQVQSPVLTLGAVIPSKNAIAPQ